MPTSKPPKKPGWPSDLPSTLLVGAGVVGTAIAEAHLERGLPFCLADQDENALSKVAAYWSGAGTNVRQVRLPIDGLAAIAIGTHEADSEQQALIVIESIVEKLDAKQQLFSSIQKTVGGDAVLCSNTSTLQIDAIAGSELDSPGQVCGFHFFMPVHARAAVEVVSGRRSSSGAIAAVVSHAKRIGKQPIQCNDGPGFIVNRMLSPYLNQALLLLSRGATEDQIERVALAYGMPMSPLELIDWIGAPTMFHAGRAFANAFPQRINPSPMVPGLVKRKRWGRSTGAGMYDYVDGVRSQTLSAEAAALVETYRTGDQAFTDGDVLLLLTIPMWIEANSLIKEGIAESMSVLDHAMTGGLGFTGHTNWSEFFAELGQQQIDSAIDRWQDAYRSMSR